MKPDNSTTLARAALSRLFEPSDSVGLGLVAMVGPVDALRIARRDLSADTTLGCSLREFLGIADGPRDPLQDGLTRWAPRLADLSPERDLATLRRLGGRLVTPETDEWPEALDDLQGAAPVCLWVRGTQSVPPLSRVAAVVGSRDSTAYGDSVTAELSSGLTERGYRVISGGAYGIDARAHRAALVSADGQGPSTIAVLAGGIDRYYPAGNEELLRSIAHSGLLISEVPPGGSPTRWRFLQRNRLIAALSAVTVVVEARWRSGALNTAHHAAGLGRPVGAVPGSVHSANSAGCHRLLRDGSAVCVTDAADVVELAGPLGGEPLGDRARAEAAPTRDQDGLTVPDLLVLDGLPVRSTTTVDKLSSVAGLSVREVISGLSRLELAGLACRTGEGWRRQRR
ncbi:DNA-protecting protein DprA [Arthrobacter echini]|uniref:DNA-protecting protein DprA n=1 Tax=Arthrobacter echini TaxID=1529066 RepID=A0A4S5E6R6_9MICC|nr:DNA-processing protein DprA [Arthrobacter echini]THJ67150.1 DNA-protecting protein DprA [Arthrobacter echini]